MKKRRRTKDINDVTGGEKPAKKPGLIIQKEKTYFLFIVSNFLATKPLTTPKAQLFKVQSNRFLKENLAITNYRKDPFFEDKYEILRNHK